MSVSYHLTVENVIPSGTELPDKTELLMKAEGNYDMIECACNFFKTTTSYRIHVWMVEIETKHSTLIFRRAGTDSPFVDKTYGVKPKY